MKYCKKCGHELAKDVQVCPTCGTDQNAKLKKEQGDFDTRQQAEIIDWVIRLGMIAWTILFAVLIIPLVWHIPMTIIVWKKISNGERIPLALAICTLIFACPVSGLLILIKPLMVNVVSKF